MNGDWLGGIYEWAGEYRTVEMEKEGFRWLPALRVMQNMNQFESGILLLHTPCRPASLEVVVRRMAEVHAELLLIHPFREGNGRLARWLAGVMALQAGFPAPQYVFVGPGSRQERAAYLQSGQAGLFDAVRAANCFFSCRN